MDRKTTHRRRIIGKRTCRFLEVLFFYACFGVIYVNAEDFRINGTVVDNSGETLIGVSVLVPGTTIGTVTDIDGTYSLLVPSASSQVQFSYIGYQSQTVAVNGRNTINVTLLPDNYIIDEVVVIGYGTQKKETVTGALASVTTKDLIQSPQANISNALAGRMPGLFSMQRSGEPGKDMSTLRIRGVGTFAEGQEPLVLVDGTESASYDQLDPNEIESITILKDASTTAVYGVRGANGVILITTKRGKTGKPQVNVSTNFALENFPFLRDNMNSYEYAVSYNQAKYNDSYVTGNYTPLFTENDIEMFRTGADPIFYPDIDWYDYMLKDFSQRSQTNVNISGGTDKVGYFVSLGYFTQEGMLNDKIYDPGYDYQVRYKRYNIRTNFDFNLSKNLTVSLDVGMQMGDLRNPNWSMGGIMEMLSSTIPMAAPGVIDNKVVAISSTFSSGFTPLVAYDKGWKREYENNLEGALKLNYKMDYLLKGLSLRAMLSYKNWSLDSRGFGLNNSNYSVRREPDGSLLFYRPDPSPMQVGWSIGKNRQVDFEAGISYDREFFGGHEVNALLLYNQRKRHDPNYQYLIPSGYQGLVGRVAYNYKKRYLAEISVGYNGSENFAEGRRFGTFPAYSLGWVITEEPFFPENKVLSFLKIRGSYGTVGNDKIGGDRFLYRPTSYEYYNNVYYFGEHGVSQQGYRGAREGKLGNELVTWEKATKLNVGVDARFWDGKIALTFDVFNDYRNNILWNLGTVPIIAGFEMPAYNLGEMKNSGYDGEITYNERIGEFNFFIRGLYSYAHNVIVYQDEVKRNYDYLQVTGHRYGQFFGLVADGLYNTWEEVNDPNRPVYNWSNNKIQPGDIRYVDVNGDGRIDDDDRVPIGYSNIPEITYGISFGGNWKGLDFSVLFQGATHVSNNPSRRTTQGFYTNTGANKELLKSWSQERYEQGLPIEYPRLAADYGGHNYQLSTYWLEDASYLRLKNVEIGYTFKNQFLKGIGVNSVRLYTNGNNLITWCKMRPGQDPEAPVGEANTEPYPVTRIFNFGLNINF